MSREIQEDFYKLEEHIGSYSLSEFEGSQELQLLLKQQHKKYLAQLIWIAELKNRENQFISNFNGVDIDICERLTEAVSDMGSAFFNWIHGNYKAARIMIRVAIENFIRSISSIWIPAQKTEMNTHALMDKARSISVLSTAKCKPLTDSLHSDYKILCGDAHTSSSGNMYSISTLADFPITDTVRGRSACDIFQRVSTNFIVMLSMLFNLFFQGFHHKNKEMVLEAIPNSKKVLVSSIDEVE